uniref:Uncharacterized protein n=1 Tax=Ascaris lumbricoides TaxID=6252 RepID=A0A0M3HJW4_ASCLU
MQRSSSLGNDRPNPIPPPYTSVRTPEAGILLTLGERIRTFMNPRRVCSLDIYLIFPFIYLFFFIMQQIQL